MKKLKGAIWAKIIAWIFVTIAGVAFLGSVIVAFYMGETKYYTSTSDEIKQEIFERISSRYTIRVLANLESGLNEKFFANTNYEYGVIEAKNEQELESMDLSADSTYIERNFTGDADWENRYVYSVEVNPSTSFYYSDSLLGGENYIMNENTVTAEYQIYQYVYDTVGGIIYYVTDNGYYPVDRIRLYVALSEDEGYHNIVNDYVYDIESGTYLLAATTASQSDESTIEMAGAELEVPEYNRRIAIYVEKTVDTANEDVFASVEEKLIQPSITFQTFDDTFLSYENWNELLLQNFEGSSNEALEVSADTIEVAYTKFTEEVRKSIQNTINYDSSRRFCLAVKYDESECQYYTVISNIPTSETLEGDWKKGDLYLVANHYIDLLYSIRFLVYFFIAAAFLIFMSALAFLFIAAGHKRDTDEIIGNWLSRTPLEMEIAVFGVLETVIVLCVFATAAGIEDVTSVFWIVESAFLCLCFCWIILGFVLNFAIRYKLGKWWKNTLIYRVSGKLVVKRGEIKESLNGHINLFWKLVLIFIILTFCEVCGLAVLRYKPEMQIMVCLLEKALIFIILLNCILQMKKLKEAGEHIAAGDLNYQVDTENMYFDFRKHGENLNSLNIGLGKAVDEKMKSERFKTELITNVSHDIKTPLTSIINYVDLLEKEEISNETTKEYLEVLDRQSIRLKKLIEDLIEASKASTGNLPVHLEKLEAGVFLVQTVGEFEEKTQKENLQLIINKPVEPIYIMADGRHFWRVIDNLMNNICKYAQEGTRVYIDLTSEQNQVTVTFRNTSKYPLNIKSEELMERFVRGDSSRNTEGSGLGLSIANSLMELMGGDFNLVIDGDLFKVILNFSQCSE